MSSGDKAEESPFFDSKRQSKLQCWFRPQEKFTLTLWRSRKWRCLASWR